jgi:pimeloyl-ACP methyl ester carboxylesterase
MIENPRGRIDYAERGAGPTVVLVPGSCSTGAAWRPVMDAWNNRFRCVTTSLLGYGGTAERRTAHDPSIWHEADMLEVVIRAAGEPVHLVGHSFGGLVGLAVAVRKRVSLKSLVVVEAPATELLRQSGDHAHYRAFRAMTQSYFAAHAAGDTQAIAAMIDFYGGAGTFAAWPPRVRDYAVASTAVNILDWASAYDFAPSPAALAAIKLPVLILRGGKSHAAVRCANAVLAARLSRAECITVEGAAHFMIATHPNRIARLIAKHVLDAEAEPGERSLHRTELRDARENASGI